MEMEESTEEWKRSPLSSEAAGAVCEGEGVSLASGGAGFSEKAESEKPLFSSDSDEDEGGEGKSPSRRSAASSSSDSESSSDGGSSDSGEASGAEVVDFRFPQYAHGLAKTPLRFETPSLVTLLAARRSLKSEAEARGAPPREALKNLSPEDLASLQKRQKRLERRGAKLAPLHALPEWKLLALPEALFAEDAKSEANLTQTLETPHSAQGNAPPADDRVPQAPADAASTSETPPASSQPATATAEAPAPADSPPTTAASDLAFKEERPLDTPSALNVHAALKTVRSQFDQIKRLRPHDVVFGCLYTRLKRQFPDRSDAALYDMAKAVCEKAKQEKRTDVLEALKGRLALAELRRTRLEAQLLLRRRQEKQRQKDKDKGEDEDKHKDKNGDENEKAFASTCV